MLPHGLQSLTKPMSLLGPSLRPSLRLQLLSPLGTSETVGIFGRSRVQRDERVARCQRFSMTGRPCVLPQYERACVLAFVTFFFVFFLKTLRWKRYIETVTLHDSCKGSTKRTMYLSPGLVAISTKPKKSKIKKKLGQRLVTGENV